MSKSIQHISFSLRICLMFYVVSFCIKNSAINPMALSIFFGVLKTAVCSYTVMPVRRFNTLPPCRRIAITLSLDQHRHILLCTVIALLPFHSGNLKSLYSFNKLIWQQSVDTILTDNPFTGLPAGRSEPIIRLGNSTRDGRQRVAVPPPKGDGIPDGVLIACGLQKRGNDLRNSILASLVKPVCWPDFIKGLGKVIVMVAYIFADFINVLPCLGQKDRRRCGLGPFDPLWVVMGDFRGCVSKVDSFLQRDSDQAAGRNPHGRPISVAVVWPGLPLLRSGGETSPISCIWILTSQRSHLLNQQLFEGRTLRHAP